MIVVTGSYGRVGRAICAELEEHGLEWQGIDLSAQPQFTPSGRFAHRQGDLKRFGSAVEMLANATAIIHTAAIAYPDFSTEHETFISNVAMTFNVLSVAKLFNIKKVVSLSSEKVYGFPFSHKKPLYFPIDESHPIQSEGAYGLSKSVGEFINNGFDFDDKYSIISIRSTLVQSVNNYPDYPGFVDDPAIRIWALWSYIDVRDLARACRLAVQADLPGIHAFSIAAPDTVMDMPSADLAAKFFPNVPTRWPSNASPFSSFCDTKKAEIELEFVAQHRWRDELKQLNGQTE
ncbi:NAD-dependent epimerase/dehydratase family protein [Sphingomonas sanguinis]|uniref:NAD-dependent epimerase/dehydratase family protein n=1 Tax=Sphingomonas sanguinis TaxID=33051 RepID=UPI0009EA1C7C|nr:NAD(P)-dependent oxidoreductase [Sphingomonas sanguinis]